MMLHNHVTSALSDLDRRMIEYVPEGGNWQAIPPGLSRRVDQIRERSRTRGLIHTTYYGRLRWDAPSYTISTYFSRSGNGCFIHPQENRLISAREAARLQSFPDAFVFTGTSRAVAAQIGNAVPPLLGMLLGTVLPGESVVDLFAGAGGLSYGLEMAGKKVAYAVELDRYAAETFRYNHPYSIVKQFDLSTAEAINELTVDVTDLGGCDLLVGGPPCQSFSTAGSRRNDERSTLVNRFVDAVRVLNPAAFVMENVLGLRSFKNGTVLKEVIADLSRLGYEVAIWDVTTDRFAIPQRRRRLLVVGSKRPLDPPQPITPAYKNGALAAVSVRDAISDLPPLGAGGGISPVSVELPGTSGLYQQYVRGNMSSGEYMTAMSTKWSGVNPMQARLR
ncbi:MULTISPECIES: DNA (cytosine-5-)-methyltransferase [Ferrimicrobium]|uniref:DNA (cytosine-5-)-methyltransferase n=1 Tax=Ferrimicrobium TaxID=121038 RepID=UPI0023F4AB8D|nr:DNA (cytosine-5-)-methyltransferase [Ferrimicrobium acidiphilum]